MYKIISLAAMAFFLFILWTIFLANTGGSSVFFDFARSIPYGDKIVHMGLFGALTFVSIIGFKFRFISLGKIKVYYGAALVSVFVIGEELSQVFIPIRTFDLVDLSADLFGICIATGLAFLVGKRLTKNSGKESASDTA